MADPLDDDDVLDGSFAKMDLRTTGVERRSEP
jgi:hypothetical protein